MAQNDKPRLQENRYRKAFQSLHGKYVSGKPSGTSVRISAAHCRPASHRRVGATFPLVPQLELARRYSLLASYRSGATVPDQHGDLHVSVKGVHERGVVEAGVQATAVPT